MSHDTTRAAAASGPDPAFRVPPGPSGNGSTGHGDAPPADALDGLREPLGHIVRTLHRLTLGRVAASGAPARYDTHLLLRARTVAGELQEIVDTLVRGGDAPGERRDRQDPVPVLAALDAARAGAADALGHRPVTVASERDLVITTNAARLHDLLVHLLREAARRAAPAEEIHVVVARVDGEIGISVEGMGADAASGRALDRIQSLARALGGKIDVVAHPEDCESVRVRLPQQRGRDGTRG